jgi:predicted DNA-binding transcriptional regulator AlpA
MAVKVPTASEIRAWPVTVDVQTAGRAFGLGRDQAYRLAREGDFPVPVLRLGRYLRVSRAAVLRVLDVDQADNATSASPLDANAVVDGLRPGG